MADILTEAELDEIEHRANEAFAVAPLPWLEYLETRYATGGCSFIALDGDSEIDHELYVSIYRGKEDWISPDTRMDAVVDFIGHAAADVPRLVAEVRRLRALLDQSR
ncbi:hypothetical protein M8C13_25480 [Crossiella sp. SN42]|uniref:hypothetical protein n=1 Tax=Crossiella sp. SN42 TaxID=2944808 RepID=UPI00207C2B94|nr:hypothetical protein [Crossiella sp. SN42]MCO1579106.1 hypothetical protein [Crossiella sp. SN42]